MDSTPHTVTAVYSIHLPFGGVKARGPYGALKHGPFYPNAKHRVLVGIDDLECGVMLPRQMLASEETADA